MLLLFRLYNAADGSTGGVGTSCEQTNVLIYPTGQVLWVPPCRYVSMCGNTLKNNPSNLLNCPLIFGSWTYDGWALGLQFYNDVRLNWI